MLDKIYLEVASAKAVEDLRVLIHTTIKKTYSKYYPKGIMDFFLYHHSYENIEKAIIDETVLLIYHESMLIGTGSIKKNEIKRVFILPKYQGKGFGTLLMNELENLVLKKYNNIELDASIPGYKFYLNRGYSPIKLNKIITYEEQVLCYYRMGK